MKPDATNTGATGRLTPYTGPTYITTPGTVIQDKQISGNLVVAAPNVVIRNSRSTGVVTAYPNGDDLLVTRFTGKGVFASSAHRLTVEFSNITNNGSDSFHVTSDQGRYINGVTLRHNYVHDPYVLDGAHYDGLQVRGATNVLVECNNFDLGSYQEGYNAPIYLENANGGFSNVRIVGNWLVGGAFNVMTSSANSDAGRTVLSDNRVGGDYRWDYCMATGALAKPAQQTGNTTLDGAPITPC